METPTKASSFLTVLSWVQSVSLLNQGETRLTDSIPWLASRCAMGSSSYAELPLQAIQATHLHD